MTFKSWNFLKKNVFKHLWKLTTPNIAGRRLVSLFINIKTRSQQCYTIPTRTMVRTVEVLSSRGPEHRVHSAKLTQPCLHSGFHGAAGNRTVSAACSPCFKAPSLPLSALSWANSQVPWNKENRHALTFRGSLWRPRPSTLAYRRLSSSELAVMSEPLLVISRH